MICGCFAAASLWVSVRVKSSWVLVLCVVFLGALRGIEHFTRLNSHSLPTSGEVQRWLSLTSEVTIALIAIGWALALHFINKEGERFFRVETEMRLAGEIHRALVPNVDRQIGKYEFCGVSLPSGQVGGDLVDLFVCGDRWLAYVADVSGHGVSSGVVMGMIKSSVHTALQHQPDAGCLLEVVNQVLCSLEVRHMFATCGLIAFSPERGLQYALAGHLPILRLRGQTIETLSQTNLPLGIFPGTKFEAFPCEMKKGDLLVIVTDGLTEVTAADGEELGFRGISKALLMNRDRPIRSVAEEMLGTASKGTRSDDQTLLLVRCIR
jgi:phosphoserine phosphatase RsbU/P